MAEREFWVLGHVSERDVSRECKEKLDLARALGSHSNPRGDLALLVEQALELWLERIQSRRFGTVERPRHVVRAREVKLRSRSRQRIRSAVLREVVARDGLQCAYVAPDGRRCIARSFLEVHHDEPWARGGTNESANLKLLCRAHNRFFAEQDFGRSHVSQSAQRRA